MPMAAPSSFALRPSTSKDGNVAEVYAGGHTINLEPIKISWHIDKEGRWQHMMTMPSVPSTTLLGYDDLRKIVTDR